MIIILVARIGRSVTAPITVAGATSRCAAGRCDNGVGCIAVLGFVRTMPMITPSMPSSYYIILPQLEPHDGTVWALVLAAA